MSAAKVLMADDEPEVLAIMAKKVAAEGYEVVTAADGQEALDKLYTENPDVLLLDLTMPRKHGFEVLQHLRENPPSAKWIPVIIVSASRELPDVKKGYSLEADHYITKPCGIHDIIKAIHLMTTLSQQRKTEVERREG